MTKLLLLLLGLAAIACAAPRSKRFAGLALAASGVGGGSGCVVTGDNLYINGFKQRSLSKSELQELDTYYDELADYKKKLKTALHERQQAMRRSFSDDDDDEAAVGKTMPELKAPAKPSFCKEEDTTQYVFDGCVVQGNKVYVGKEFARDLSSQEIQQLKAFDEKMSVYQKWAQQQMQKQMKNLFGGNDFFSALFSGKKKSAPTTSAPETEAPEAPEAPRFCTAIY